MYQKSVRSLRSKLTALPVSAGVGALVVLGAGATIGAPSSDAVVVENVRSAPEPATTSMPQPTLKVALATPTISAAPCDKRETLPCLG